MKDRIYKKKLNQVQDFQFNQQVSEVFENMILRSVPEYNYYVQDSALIAQWLYHKINKTLKKNKKKQFIVYDLGCSTLKTSVTIAQSINQSNLKIYAIDNSESMLKKAKQAKNKIINIENKTEIDLILADIRNIKFNSHHLSVLNFILQFINSAEKTELLKKIFSSLKIGGMVVIAEKIIFSNSKSTLATNNPINELINEMHYNFKKTNNYSNLEIEQNLMALKNIMYLESSKTLLRRLKKIGFSNCTLFRQSLNFASIVAIKS